MSTPKANRKPKDRGSLYLYGGMTLAIIAIIGSAVLYQQSQARWVEAIKTYNYKSGQHVAGTVKYKENPPAGGNHNPKWANCGFYPIAVPNELAVHSMEHGAVWITYRPELDQESILKLAALTDNSAYVLVSPNPGQKLDVIATAWNNQLKLKGMDDDRLQKFLQRFVQGPQTPEPGAACIGGVGQPQ